MVEDAAQAVMSKYKGRYLGTIGHLGCISFHYTKNISCGEGGALLVNDQQYVDRAYVVWEKGTNRFDFLRGKVNKYCWVDVGSSFVPSEPMCAYLFAQLEEAHEITKRRAALWRTYKKLLQPVVDAGQLAAVSCAPVECETNGHIFFVMFSTSALRDTFKARMQLLGVECFSHYVALHDAPAGRMYGSVRGSMDNTFSAQDRLLRMPLWCGMTVADIHFVVASTCVVLGLAPPSYVYAYAVFQCEWATSSPSTDSFPDVTVARSHA